MRIRSVISISPIADAITTAANAVVGKFCSKFGAANSSSSDRERANDAGQLSTGARGLRDRRSRRTAADWKTLKEPSGQIGGPEAHHLLIGIDISAAFGPHRRGTARWYRRRRPGQRRLRRSERGQHRSKISRGSQMKATPAVTGQGPISQLSPPDQTHQRPLSRPPQRRESPVSVCCS